MSLVVQTQDAGTAAAADDPLLSYTVATIPSPLKASPENPEVPEEPGELIFSATRQAATNQPADIEWIKVKVPAGTMAPDLATDLAKISPRISLDGWSARLDAVAKEFVFEPTGSHATIGPDTGFTIQLSDIPMSRKVGTAPITVTERSRTGNSAFQNRPIVFNIGKFPADFYLRNFLCEPSIIPNGGDVKLTWERSANATYELLYPGVDLDVTKRTSLDIEGIKSDTTFYIRATTGDPTNPAVRILSAQVTVIKPDLEVGNLDVGGTLNVAGGWFDESTDLPTEPTGNGVRHYIVPEDGFFEGWVKIQSSPEAEHVFLRVWNSSDYTKVSDATAYSNSRGAQYASLFRTARKGESIYIGRGGSSGNPGSEVHLRFTPIGRKS
ncbi:hypothetical protein P3T36_003037 [Kitasatospora sp. MAP12-15]|uniref:hypothetical protein n=1 Tax=unclassified Kitasatospora TaxID=2633591 RepID=UPI002475590C|nr:hypothetical protein [Kitasatospora sp. MAP12-44]MDH6110668.1 hypothetical protein [Kitasatospora sp. MAP12-44]